MKAETLENNLILSKAEKEVDEYLNELKNEVYALGTDKNCLSAQYFTNVKERIEATKLFEFLQKMPKGAVLHVHLTSAGDFKWIVDTVTYWGDCYVYRGDDGSYSYGALGIFDSSTPSESWKRTVDEREASGDPKAYDSVIYHSITIQSEDVASSNAWDKFNRIFPIINPLFYNEKFFREYLVHTFNYYAIKDNVNHLEIHTSSFLYDSALNILLEVLDEMKRNGCFFSVISIGTKSRRKSPKLSDAEFRAAIKKQALLTSGLMSEYPDIFTGFDLVSNEQTGCPTSYFASTFVELALELSKENKVLPFYFHDGESSWSPLNGLGNAEYSATNSLTYDNNIYDAYLLNSKRIGHALTLARSPRLLRMCRDKEIAIECCPISNQVLQYVQDLRMHPAILFMNSGLPVTLSPDNPGVFQYSGVAHDFWEACIAWNLDLKAIKSLCMNSIKFSSLDSMRKKHLFKRWRKNWKRFINKIKRGIRRGRSEE